MPASMISRRPKLFSPFSCFPPIFPREPRAKLPPAKWPWQAAQLVKKVHAGLFLTALSAGHFDAVKTPLRSNGLFSSLLTAAYLI